MYQLLHKTLKRPIMRRFSRVEYLFVLITACFSLAGCVTETGNCIPSHCGGPVRLVPVDVELEPIREGYNYPNVLTIYNAARSEQDRERIRNEFIFARTYAMDVNYTAYEEGLTRESQDESFWAAVTNAGLTGAGALIPVAQTTRLLSGIAAGLTTVDQAYNKQYLLNKAIQILQSQMRAKRADVLTHIVARTLYPVSTYPLGMAMSDLEQYYQAGTLSAAFIDLSENTAMTADLAKRTTDNIKPGAPEVAKAVRAAGTVIVDVNKPLPEIPKQPPPNPTGPDPRFNVVERDLRVAALQTACGLTATGQLGGLGSPTRSKLAAYLNSIRPIRKNRTMPKDLGIFDQKDGDDLNALLDDPASPQCK
jgi:hypothetical protein